MYKAVVRRWNDIIVIIEDKYIHNVYKNARLEARLEAADSKEFVYVDLYDPFGNMFMSEIYYYNKEADKIETAYTRA